MPTTSIVALDYTSHSVVVKCSACPWWSAFAFDRAEGWQTGARHQQRVHPGTDQAAANLRANNSTN